MLPAVGTAISDGFVRKLTFVRSLEEYEGPILTEWASEAGGTYLEKWCTQTPAGDVFRSLIVRCDTRSVELYLAGKLDLKTTLLARSDGFGFLVDRSLDDATAVYLVDMDSLPDGYLPSPAARHDPSLRPASDRTRQMFLLGADWTGAQIGTIERSYLDAAAFNFFAAKSAEGDRFPTQHLQYKYRRGYPVANAFAKLRDEQPARARPRAVVVQAASPGLLAFEIDTKTAANILRSVRKVRDAEPLYKNVQTWASQDIDGVVDLPPDAAEDLKHLADVLDLELDRFGVSNTTPDDRIMTVGKLLTSYFRKLQKLADPKLVAEFIGYSEPG